MRLDRRASPGVPETFLPGRRGAARDASRNRPLDPRPRRGVGREEGDHEGVRRDLSSHGPLFRLLVPPRRQAGAGRSGASVGEASRTDRAGAGRPSRLCGKRRGVRSRRSVLGTAVHVAAGRTRLSGPSTGRAASRPFPGRTRSIDRTASYVLGSDIRSGGR